MSRIVVFQNRFDTIAMPLPEGNAGFIGDCSFEQHRAYATESQVVFALLQEHRTDSPAPKRFHNVERCYVPERRIFLRQQKANDESAVSCDQAFRAWLRQKMLQHR